MHSRWKKLAAGLLMLAAAASPQAPLAYAGVEACDIDPPLLVRTPAGTPVLVNNFLSVPFENRGALHRIEIAGSSSPGLTPGTSQITVTVLVPKRGKNLREATDDEFSVRIKSVVQRYDRVAVEASGRAGTPITVSLVVPVP